MNGRDDRIRRAARRYAALLRLYPKRYRQAFGAQMLQTFKDYYRDASEREGGVGLTFWLAVVGDELQGIAREQTMTLRARRILLILIALGVIEFPIIALFRLKHLPLLLTVVLTILPLLAMFSAILLSVLLLKTWVRTWPVVAIVLLAVSALGVFGAQNAVRAENTNTWCITIHTPSSQPPAALVTAADYFVQGDYDYDRGDCTRAIADYSQAIALDPAFAEAYNNRAYAYMAQQEYARALPDLDRAILLRPDYPHALMNRGDIYNYYYQIDRPRAIADYDRLIALGPDATRDTSVCGHRFLAKHNGWNLGTILDFPNAGC